MKPHTCRLACTFFASILFFTAFAAPVQYRIKAKFKGLPDGIKMELVPGATHKNEKPISTTVTKNGQFEFNGKVDEPRLFYVRMADKGMGRFKIIVENSNVEVTGEVDSAERNGDQFYEFKNVDITGSKSQDLYEQKLAMRNLLDKKYEEYHKNNEGIIKAMAVAGENKDTVLLDSLRNSPAYKKLAQDEREFFESVNSVMEKLFQDNKSTWWGPFLFLDQRNYFTPDDKKLFDQFSEDAKNSYYGKLLKTELFPPSLVGKAAPSLNCEDDAKKPLNYTNVAAGKKYIVLDFWASWCNPCRKQIPSLLRLYNEKKDKGLEIISVSIDKKEADWKKALEEENLPWPNFLDTKEMADSWSVKAIPAMFVLDANGKVVAENVSFAQLEEMMKGL